MLKRILYNPWIEWEPHPATLQKGPSDKQMEFLLQDKEEGLFGGAVRGAKSWGEMAAAVMYVDVPQYDAIIIRKHYDDIEQQGGLLDICDKWEWEEKGAKWNAGERRYEFPSGARVGFGHMGDEGRKGHLRYKSSWFQFIGFDQVEEIPLNQYLYMNSRLGRPLQLGWLPLRMWSTANPDGLEWVYDRFVNPETRNRDTFFIPATADDNPWVDVNALERRLMNLDPVTYQQLRKGIWGLSTAGGIFKRDNLIKRKGIPWEKRLMGCRYWDTAGTEEREDNNPAYTVGGLFFRDIDSNDLFISDMVRVRQEPRDVQVTVRETALLDSEILRDLKALHIKIYMEQQPGDSGKFMIDEYARKILPEFDFEGHRPSGSKVDRAGPFAAAVGHRRVYLCISKEYGGDWVEPYIRELVGFPNGQYKDQVDVSSGAYSKLFSVELADPMAY